MVKHQKVSKYYENDCSNKSDSPRGTEDDLASPINGEFTSRCDNEANSLDIISESLDNFVKCGDTVSEKIATIVRDHYFDEKPKKKVKAIISKYDLPSNLNEFVPAKVNIEVWRACSTETRETDLKMQAIQKSLVASLGPLSLLSNKLL